MSIVVDYCEQTKQGQVICHPEKKKHITKIMCVAENNRIQIVHLLNIHVEVTTFVISVTLFCLHKQRYTLLTLFHK